MGILGFMVVLFNNIIEFLIFWHAKRDQHVIPCTYVSIIFLIYIPTVINYSILLCVTLWAAEIAGCLLMLILAQYFETDFIITFTIMLCALAVFANVSTYQNFRKIKQYYKYAI